LAPGRARERRQGDAEGVRRANELVLSIPFDLLGGLFIVRTEGFGVGVSLPLEGQRVAAAGPLSEKGHRGAPPS